MHTKNKYNLKPKKKLDEATAEITGVGGKTLIVIKHPRTKIATIIDKSTREKEFIIARDCHVDPPSSTCPQSCDSDKH